MAVNDVRRMPVGEDDFKELRVQQLYYVDKSLLIKAFIDDGAKVNLIARPRRFGKTLNLSMLRYFFEKTQEDHSVLFRDLQIWQQGERYRREQGKYPVVALTLKSLKSPKWTENYEIMRALLSGEFLRHRYVYDSGCLSGQDQIVFGQMLTRSASEADYSLSLTLLSRALHAYYGEKVIILLDEYDTLLNEAYTRGFYDEAISFLRMLLGEAFKNNIHLHKGMLTGIFRVAKESVFSGLNNLKASTIVHDDYREYFGFTEPEVQAILSDFGLEEQLAEVTRWYNGYRFGSRQPLTVYNPWSIAQYAEQGELIPYWVNTSSNEIVRQLITEGNSEVQQLAVELLERRPIGPVGIDDTIVYREIDQSPDAVWSFLLLSGYLKPLQLERREDGGLYSMLDVPNQELYFFYRTMLRSWLTNAVGGNVKKMLESLKTGDIHTFHSMFADTVRRTFSYHDVGEDRAETFLSRICPGFGGTFAGGIRNSLQP